MILSKNAKKKREKRFNYTSRALMELKITGKNSQVGLWGGVHVVTIPKFVHIFMKAPLTRIIFENETMVGILILRNTPCVNLIESSFWSYISIKIICPLLSPILRKVQYSVCLQSSMLNDDVISSQGLDQKTSFISLQFTFYQRKNKRPIYLFCATHDRTPM